MLWSFIIARLSSRILVFLSSCKQVRFVYEAFKKLPDIPLKCLHGRMKQIKQMFILQQFVEQRSNLFSTDVPSRGLIGLFSLLEESEDEEILDLLLRRETADGEEQKEIAADNMLPITRVNKKKNLKINVHRPVGTRVVFDEGNTVRPLARLADLRVESAFLLGKDKVMKRYADLKKDMKTRDQEDKLLDRKRH